MSRGQPRKDGYTLLVPPLSAFTQFLDNFVNQYRVLLRVLQVTAPMTLSDPTPSVDMTRDFAPVALLAKGTVGTQSWNAAEGSARPGYALCHRPSQG
jgi:hypothetical protein